jgi:hypothetical protein
MEYYLFHYFIFLFIYLMEQPSKSVPMNTNNKGDYEKKMKEEYNKQQ